MFGVKNCLLLPMVILASSSSLVSSLSQKNILFPNLFFPYDEFGVKDCPDAGEPLLLTPYILRNDTATARKLSTVATLPDDSVGTRSYSGFITVNESDNGNLFFWMFEPTNVTLQRMSPEQVPLFIYLEGGPGYSSLFALFESNGPFFVTENLTLAQSVRSLTNLGRVLYIDNPVGVGYSFTNSDDGLSRNEQHVSTNLYTFLAQFYQIFPELLTSPLYLTGESYAGKYVPALAHQIHSQQQSLQKIPLTGVIIGDGYSDPQNMVGAYGQMLFDMGMVTGKNEFLYVQNSTTAIRAAIEAGQLAQALQLNTDLLFSYFPKIAGSAGYLYNINKIITRPIHLRT